MNRRQRAPALLLAAACGCATAGVAHAADTAERKTSAEARQAELRERIRALKTDLARTEGDRSEARDALHASETAISDANRRLRELARQHKDTQARLATVLGERRRTETAMAEERARLGELVRAQYFASRTSPVQAMLSGENPNALGRYQTQLGYFARARQETVTRLADDERRLAELAAAEQERAADLARNAAEQEKERRLLQAEKAARASTLQKVSDRIRAQRKEVGALERDAARLNGLIGKLTRLIADENRRARARREAASRAERERAAPTRVPSASAPVPAPGPAPATATAARDDADDTSWAGAGTPFAALRGKLRLPVRGEIAGRYGQPRPDSKMTWKGVLIGATQGAEVSAVAAGRVVFADWLRGFGNLLILDHGDQYLTIYGGNETMYKQAGQTVEAGETIATVGSSGGAEKSGLYFEIRHRGEPFDPLRWMR